MFENNRAKWKWIFAILLLANIVYYFYANWGLVTIKALNKPMPLGEIIKSIEWQGWVKIYTNLPPDTMVNMYADHVPVSEAMEILAANVDVPPSPDGDDGSRPSRDNATPPGAPSVGSTPSTDNSTNLAAGAPPANGTSPGSQDDARPHRGGGFGGRRRAEWNLAFFVAPTPADVQTEIREFETGDPNSNDLVYTYNTSMEMVATESLEITADPRLQAWPGMKPTPPTPDPADASAATAAANSDSSSDSQPNPAAAATPNVHTYLQAFAQAANIWIMAPGTWTPDVANPPPPNSSIISAVKRLVSGSNGSVTEAFVLRAGRGGVRTGNRDFASDDGWEDRMRNAINGLPPDERPDALAQLGTEVNFRKQLRALPPEQRRQKMRAHFMERMLYGERLSRLSPIKRAQVYQRMVNARMQARGQK